MAESPEGKKSLRELVGLILRHRGLFLLGAVLFATTVLVGAHYWPPLKYTGTTKFERRSDAAAATTGRQDSESFGTIKLTLEHDLVGQDALERVVEELGLLRGLPHNSEGQLTRAGEMDKQQLVRDLRKKIKVDWEVRSDNVDLISLDVTHRDPALAQQIPNALVKNYINNVSKEIIQRLTASRDFLLKQVSNTTGRLTELTNRRIEFETKHAGMMPESPGALQHQIDQLLADIDTLGRQEQTAEQTLARLRTFEQATTAPSTQPVQVRKGPNPELKRLEDQLREARDALDAYRTFSHMTDEHPKVKAMRAKIAQLKQEIKKTPAEATLDKLYTTSPSSDSVKVAIAAAQADLKSTGRELERRRKRLDDLQSLMANFAPIRQQYLQIVKGIEEQQAEVKRWQDRLTGVQMALAGEVAERRTHLDAVEAAQKQFRPSFPRLYMVLGLAIVGGLAFGAGLVFLSNLLDRSVTTTQDAVDRFGLPVHGVIGEIVPTAQRRLRRLKRWVLLPVVSLVLLVCLTLSGLSIVLRLHYPTAYERWRVSPTSFLSREGAQRLARPSGRRSM